MVAYEEMVSWATDAANWATIESELTTKGVKVQIKYFSCVALTIDLGKYLGPGCDLNKVAFRLNVQGFTGPEGPG